MPKMKTKRAAAKRFKVTGTGKIKRFKAYKRHILTKKSTGHALSLIFTEILNRTGRTCTRLLFENPDQGFRDLSGHAERH